jgi:alpha-glucosidase (family GH31 glycosyl hydrolase)
MTLSMQALHHPRVKHIDAHANYGHMMAKATHSFLSKHEALPFILSRSMALGASRYAAHWTGDNMASWEFLKAGLVSHALLNIFGVQMVGSDICGHKGRASEELCARWLQLGSLYPFARLHKNIDSGFNEPYLLGELLARVARANFLQRYGLIHQLYSELARLNGTGTFLRPLFLNFPQDTSCPDQDESVLMLTDLLLTVAVTEPGVK